MGQHVQGLAIAGAGVAHPAGQALHGLNVLGEHLEAGVDHLLDGRRLAVEVRGQRLHHHLGGVGLDGADTGRVVGGAAVVQVIAVHRGKHHVAQAHQLHGPGGVGRFLDVQPAARVAGVHGAEAAGAGAHRAHQHDGGGAVAPALAHVGAVGFGAHGAQAVLADVALNGLEALAAGNLGAQPLGLAARDTGALLLAGALLDAVLDGREAVLGTEFLAAGDVFRGLVAHWV
jgi:hypothetical protein